ncbi:hypothetical protein [Streptomyces sp. NPDC056061]|uniref:hypothetical protein n=1 Tax=Streptomyces sp. NPDC056061 TaxID=3345700 RepID=UPI0035DBA3B4
MREIAGPDLPGLVDGPLQLRALRPLAQQFGTLDSPEDLSDFLVKRHSLATQTQVARWRRPLVCSRSG